MIFFKIPSFKLKIKTEAKLDAQILVWWDRIEE